MRASRGLLAVAVLFVTAIAFAADARKVKIKWRPVESAVKYDVELSEKAEMDPLIQRKDFKGTEAQLQLKPGTYFFRVRGIDSSDSPGPWSEVSGFVVNAAPPKPLVPESGAVIEDRLGPEGLKLEWSESSKGTTYLLQIRDIHGPVLTREVDGTQFPWVPTGAGRFQWRVGHKTATGEEWSKPFSFTVKRTAIEDAPPPAPSPKPSELPVPDAADAYAKARGEEKVENAEEWWGIARIAQALAAYSFNDLDTGNSASGAAFVRLLSAEVRWRQERSEERQWSLSASFNFEMISQTVLDQSFNLPRGYLRAFYGRETGDGWRVGGLAQLNAGESGIFVVETATTARDATVFREGAGLGAFATYQASPKMFLSALALLRMDFGGSSDQLPSALASSLAYEMGFGVAVNLTPRIQVEGRLRALEESFSWRPASAAASGNSSLSDVFLILDLGVAYRF
jgi:hypothetical protein